MRRRQFLVTLAGIVAAPAVSRAQRTTMPVIGYLGSESAQVFASRLEAFKQGLRDRGFIEGQNVTFEYRWADSHNERLATLAADLVSRRVEVIATPGSAAAARAAKNATSTIPIVFETGADPVAVGLVQSLHRPGGNLTGVTSLNLEVGPKRLELLHELVPNANVVAVLINPTNPNAAALSGELEQRATRIGVRTEILRASSEADFESGVSAARQMHAALIVSADPLFASRARQLAALVVRHMVPAVHQSPEFARAGGLASYGGDVRETHHAAGAYVGRVLKGEKPAELPVQQVTSVQFVLNIDSARKLGLKIPLSLSGCADEVIE